MISRTALTSLALLLTVASATAQYRPSYAANGFQYPRPFIGADANNNDNDGTVNRIGNDNTNTNTNTAPSKDALGFDTSLVEAANNYPEEHKPFWLLNREHIMTHLGLDPQTARGPNQGAQPTQGAAAVRRPVQRVQTTQTVQPARVRPARPQQPQEPTIFELAAGAQNNGPSPSTP